MSSSILRTSVLLFLLISINIHPSTYYKAQEFWESPYWGEPILDKPGLNNFVVKIKSGSTDEASNCAGIDTNVLNICGPTKLSKLTKGVPSSVLNKYPDSPINNVWSIDNLSREFGNITFQSDFRSTTLEFYMTQNINKGFFIGSIFEIENNKFSTITFKDSTRKTDLPNTITEGQWQSFINNFFTNIAKYGVNMPRSVSKKGLTKADLFGGWARSFTNTDYLDFVDFTAVIGLSFPTGSYGDSAFNLYYNLGKSMSSIISVRAAIGVWNWLTAGISIGTEIYSKYNRLIPMKTDSEQCGLIKLARGMAKIDKKPMVNFGFFIKAEQFYRSLSIIFAFQSTHQKKTYLYPEDIFTFNYNVVNADCALRDWTMHTINFCIDYDFANDQKPCLPKVGVFFDIPIDGKGIFKTKQSGAGLAIKAEW